MSHHLDEVLNISDRITVLRNGRKVAVVDGKTSDKDGLISMIVGRALGAAEPDQVARSTGDAFLTLDGVSRVGRLADVTLTVKTGEMVGTYWPDRWRRQCPGGGDWRARPPIRQRGYAARRRGLRAGFGARGDCVRGTVHPGGHARQGAGDEPLHRPEHFACRALVSCQSWLASLRKEHAVAAEMSDRLDLNPRTPSREVRFLSGGNQRKALLGRAIFANGRLFVLEEPTQGVESSRSSKSTNICANSRAGAPASSLFRPISKN